MIMRLNDKSKSISSMGYRDKSQVKCLDKLVVQYDNDRGINWLLIPEAPKGDIISFILDLGNGEVANVDGKFNIAGNRIEFLYEQDYSGHYAEIKYLV